MPIGEMLQIPIGECMQVLKPIIMTTHGDGDLLGGGMEVIVHTWAGTAAGAGVQVYHGVGADPLAGAGVALMAGEARGDLLGAGMEVITHIGAVTMETRIGAMVVATGVVITEFI